MLKKLFICAAILFTTSCNAEPTKFYHIQCYFDSGVKFIDAYSTADDFYRNGDSTYFIYTDYVTKEDHRIYNSQCDVVTTFKAPTNASTN